MTVCLEGGERVVRHEVVGEAHGDGVGAAERRARQRGVQAEQPGRARQDEVPPTSGMKPMPTSGIAIFVVSVTTRTLPWAPTPTPPPITMPSISATYGLGKRPIWALSTYSSYQNCRASDPSARAL